jgi:N-acetylmuramoyl-L-alanine amidase/AmpD protein
MMALWSTSLLIALLPATHTPDEWPNPKTPMPSRTDWRDPGYLQIEWIQSPNFGKRPHGINDVTTIVIHSTVIPTLELTTEAFQRDEKHNPAAVSSHFTIGKDGSIVQNVSTFSRAWHAGKSWDAAGRNNVNDYSIGIELVNLDNGKDPYPDAQIQALCGIIAEMRRRFPIKELVSHEFIAQPPGRKNDPAGFPWERLKYFGLPMYTGLNHGSVNPSAGP